MMKLVSQYGLNIEILQPIPRGILYDEKYLLQRHFRLWKEGPPWNGPGLHSSLVQNLIEINCGLISS